MNLIESIHDPQVPCVLAAAATVLPEKFDDGGAACCVCDDVPEHVL